MAHYFDETDVKGIYYCQGAEGRWNNILHGKTDGSLITLERDHNNAADENAVAFLIDGETSGYVDKSIAKDLAPLMDAGWRMRPLVQRLEDDTGEDLQIKMLVSCGIIGISPDATESEVTDFESKDWRGPGVKIILPPKPAESTLGRDIGIIVSIIVVIVVIFVLACTSCSSILGV